jgi:enamine deaminase RidA (YjgF/YER057c/UK114 family)
LVYGCDIPLRQSCSLSAHGGFGMTSSRTIVDPAHWHDFFRATAVPAAQWSGDRLYVSGHTAETLQHTFPEDPIDQIQGTFANLGATLSEAGVDWANVVVLRSYHVGLRGQAEPLIAIAAQFLSTPFPPWTAVGVAELFDSEAVVEIELIADRMPRGRQ